MVTYETDDTYGYRIRYVNGIPIDFIKIDGRSTSGGGNVQREDRKARGDR